MKKLQISMMVMAVAVIAIITTGCTSINTNDGANAVSVDRLQLPYEPVLECQKQKVSNEANVSVLFGFITWGESKFADDTALGDFSLFAPTAQVKAAAVYKACKANNADLLMAAKYEIETQNYFVFKKVNCKVAGYPATVKGIQKSKK
jgi:hypothetical protein